MSGDKKNNAIPEQSLSHSLFHNSVVCSSYLQGAAFSRVEHQEAAEDALTVSGHVEGHAVLSSQHTLAQLL